MLDKMKANKSCWRLWGVISFCILCFILKYKVLLPLFIGAIVLITFWVNRKLMKNFRKKETQEVQQ